MRSWWSFSAEPPAGADEAVLRRFVEVSRRGEITAIANSASSEEELGELVPNELCEAYEAEIGFVVVARGGARRCEVVGSIGLTDEERGKLRDDPLCAEALTAERPTRHIGEDLLGVGARSVALAPFVTPRRDRVVVGAARLYERGFDDGELALLSAAAETVGHALERAWAHAELEARTRQQESAAELGVRALNEPSLDALMREAVTQVGRTLEVEYAAITELLPDGKAVLRAALGFPGDLAAEDVLVFGGRALDEAAVGARRGDGRSNLAPALVERGIESAVSAVITGVGRPFGVVAAYSKSARDFGENDRLFLRSVANVLAAAVRRSRAEAALRTGEERLELALRAGRMAAWEWDVRTGVVRWSRGLEESLGLGPGSVAEMYEDFLQLVHADDRDSVRRAIREALERRGDYHSEFRVVPSD